MSQAAEPPECRSMGGPTLVTMDTYGRLFPPIDEAIAEGLDAVFKAHR
jgi:hypothetical protein